MSYAESHHDLVGGLAGAAGMAIFSGMANGRAKYVERQANISVCDAAAAGASAHVYQASAAALRERLADAEEDVAMLTARNNELEGKLRAMATYIQDIRAGRIAA